ncbi:hypothetical protein HPB51_022344 [Rhipicephalus microplus]|uniref:Uncharacterized protein n=1 Tax=Rhipicephalus microplus TaxID=6941 RepID=A0A9J6CV34_RHIMP|nr:hypothetical protein HPB51_029137 [Rhipicephalus microplus]KAH8037735.1 hypothetical protein HPB51_016283 [Rhipicephalus microplus]KAH8038110.1 hypothetical protein HPB51_022344 [Rhipicephalus microplus]
MSVPTRAPYPGVWFIPQRQFCLPKVAHLALSSQREASTQKASRTPIENGSGGLPTYSPQTTIAPPRENSPARRGFSPANPPPRDQPGQQETTSLPSGFSAPFPEGVIVRASRQPGEAHGAWTGVTSSQGWQAAFRCARASSEQLRDKRPCRKPKHRRGQSPPPQGQPRSLARGIVSCSVAPAPTGVAQFFERDGNCEALRPTADYDENALSFANVSPTRAGDFFRFAASRRAVLSASTAYAANRKRRAQPPHLPALCARTFPVRAAKPGGGTAPQRVRAPGLRDTLLTSRATSATQGCDLAHFAHGWRSFAGRLSLLVFTVR